MDKQKQVKEGGNPTFSVKLTQAVYDLVNILCEGLQHGTNGNDLVKMFIQSFIESAKHNGPLSTESRMFLNMLKLDAGWNKAFNFADVTAQTEVAQVILVLQQKGRRGFGMKMISKPFCGDATETMCVDDIMERVVEIAMKGLYRQLREIGNRIGSESMRETLITMCDEQNIVQMDEDFQREMPGYGDRTDFGRAIEYANKTKSLKHRTPDSLANSQQRIRFDDDDREVADYEVQDWEGEHRQTDIGYGEKDDRYLDGLEERARQEDADLEEHERQKEADDLESDMGFKPFGGEW